MRELIAGELRVLEANNLKTREGRVAEATFALFAEKIAIPNRGSLVEDLRSLLVAAGAISVARSGMRPCSSHSPYGTTQPLRGKARTVGSALSNPKAGVRARCRTRQMALARRSLAADARPDRCGVRYRATLENRPEKNRRSLLPFGPMTAGKATWSKPIVSPCSISRAIQRHVVGDYSLAFRLPVRRPEPVGVHPVFASPIRITGATSVKLRMSA
jgi:hypothetical protein